MPSDFLVVSAFPETRSGVCGGRWGLLLGEALGDLSTLRNPEVVMKSSTWSRPGRHMAPLPPPETSSRAIGICAWRITASRVDSPLRSDHRRAARELAQRAFSRRARYGSAAPGSAPGHCGGRHHRGAQRLRCGRRCEGAHGDRRSRRSCERADAAECRACRFLAPRESRQARDRGRERPGAWWRERAVLACASSSPTAAHALANRKSISICSATVARSACPGACLPHGVPTGSSTPSASSCPAEPSVPKKRWQSDSLTRLSETTA